MKRLLGSILAIGLVLISTPAFSISETEAILLAKELSGCGEVKKCQIRAQLKNDQWIMIVSTIYGYRQNGKPVFKPGGWVGFTLSQEGKLLHKMPGR